MLSLVVESTHGNTYTVQDKCETAFSDIHDVYLTHAFSQFFSLTLVALNIELPKLIVSLLCLPKMARMPLMVCRVSDPTSGK